MMKKINRPQTQTMYARFVNDTSENDSDSTQASIFPPRPRAGAPSKAKNAWDTHVSLPLNMFNHTATQKLGAAKIVIPGDKTRPNFLVKALHYCCNELRTLGASRYR